MSEKEAVHLGDVHNAVSDEEKRKEYRRQWMARKRAAEKARAEHQDDREGRVDASEVGVDAVPLPGPIAVNLTRTDRKFENHRPGYWIYGKEMKERECWKCGDKFQTRLEMNKFCSPKCKENWLSDAFGKLRVQEKANL